MNVPAWPMPIHQTKLVMANAHATGMLFPHTPMPRAMVYVTVTMRSSVPNDDTANSVHQSGVERHSGASSWSVSEASSGRPRMIGQRPGSGARRASARTDALMCRSPAPDWDSAPAPGR
jgi:hypothetical protein